MNLRRLSAAGATAALAAGALVGLGTSAASAATVTNSYTCDLPKFDGLPPTFDTALTITGALPITNGPSGLPVKAGLFGAEASAAIDAQTAGILNAFGVTSARADDFGFAVGKASTPLPLKGNVVNEGGAVAWKATGTNKAFVTPDAGQFKVLLPKTFTFIAETPSLGDVSIPCALKAGETQQSVGDLTLVKQTTKTTAKAKPKGKVTVTVTGNVSKATSGQVVVLDGKKVVGKANVKNGKAVVKLKKLSKGTHKLVASFKGNGSFGKSKSKPVKVVVK